MKSFLLLALLSSPVAEQKLDICDVIYKDAHTAMKMRQQAVPLNEAMHDANSDSMRYFLLSAYAQKQFDYTKTLSREFANSAYIQCMMKLENK